MDPIAALGVAGNIVQFIDFSLKVVSKAREIYVSSHGALSENVDVEILVGDIAGLTTKLVASSSSPTGNDSLDEICRRCTFEAKELSTALQKMKVDGEKSKVKSIRKALKSMWGKKGVDEMKKRLEGYRDEMQFHVLVDLKCNIDVISANQLERLNSLDEYAKAFLETLSNNHESIRDAISSQTLKSDEQTKLALGALTENHESLRDAISSESTKSDKRHEETTGAIVVKQEETLVEVKQALESMDASSRAESEATRRELEQMKQVMAQIEQDMARRDVELQVLLIELSKSRTDNDRKKLQEKSNAVTIALFALFTVYQSLQKMALGIIAQTQFVSGSKDPTQFWDAIPSKPLYMPELIVGKTMQEAVVNKPSNFGPLIYGKAVSWMTDFERKYGTYSGRLDTMWALKWSGLEVVDYKTMGNTSGLKPEYLDLVRHDVCVLSEILDLSIKSPTDPDLGHIYEKTRSFLDSKCRTLELLKSLVIISTILVQCLGLSATTEVMDAVLTETVPREYQAAPGLRDLLDFKSIPWIDTSAILFNQRLAQVTIWSTLGGIAGFRKTAETILKSRLQKWDAEQDFEQTANSSTPKKFLIWFIQNKDEPFFFFSIGTTELGRTRAAMVFAMVEFLMKFGFSLTSPTVELGKSGLLQARVGRVKSGESHEIQRTREKFAELYIWGSSA